MSFPIYPDKHKLSELYGAPEIVGYRKQVGRMPSLAAPSGVLFCLERGLPWRMRWPCSNTKRCGPRPKFACSTSWPPHARRSPGAR